MVSEIFSAIITTGTFVLPDTSVGMALFLFAVDSTLAWVIQLLTGRTE